MPGNTKMLFNFRTVAARSLLSVGTESPASGGLAQIPVTISAASPRGIENLSFRS
jgi:hypothetical protein